MKKLLVIFALMLACTYVYSQQRIVSGKVLLNKQFPLGNIIVTAKKAKSSVSTDLNGNFSIACEKNDVLYFEAKPFYKVKKKVKNAENIEVVMRMRKADVDKDHMIDNGFLQMKYVEAAMKSIQTETDERFYLYKDIYEVIQRKFPSVQVKGSRVVVRGENNLRGNSGALFVLNGAVVAEISHIEPSTLKSISLLKGAQAALYGVRGAGGVVVIRTK